MQTLRLLSFVILSITLITFVSSTKTTAAKIATLVNTFVPTATSPGCVAFNEHVSSYGIDDAVPLTVISQLLDNLKSQTKYRCIMIYGVDPHIVALAKTKGFKVMGIVWLSTDNARNQVEISNALTSYRTYTSNIVGFSCGSELGFRSGTGSTITNIVRTCINALRNANVTVPIGINESLKIYNQGWSGVISEVDFLGANIYPWYDNAAGSCLTYLNAAQQTFKRFTNLKLKYNKPVIVTETGWPGTGAGSVGCGVASDTNQKYVYKTLTTLFKANAAPLTIFSGFRAPWKVNEGTGSTGPYWGFCKGTSPYTCFNQPLAW